MKREDIQAIMKLLRPMAIRIANIVSRGVVHLSDDLKKLQLLQIGGLSGETIDNAEHFQPYGFSSVPLEGAEVVVLFPGGDRSHPIVIAAPDRRHRPTDGDAGDVMLYHHSGSSVRLGSNGDILLTQGPGGAVKLAGAAGGAINGTQRDSAEQTFLTALSAYVTAIKPIADPTNAATPAMTAAITAFKAAVTAAISSLVKLS